VIGQSAVFTNIDMKRRRWLSKVYFQCEKCSLSKEISKFFFRNEISKLISDVKGALQ